LLLNPIDNDSRVKKEIKSLLTQNFKVTLISVNSKEQFLEDHYIIRNKQNNFKIRGIKFLILSSKFIFKILNSIKNLDYIHCNDAQTLHLGLLGKIIKPKIKLIYDTHELAKDQGGNKLAECYYYFIEKIGIKFANKVITVSPPIADFYRKEYNIPLPLVVMNCPPKTKIIKTNNIFREKFKLAPENKIFLYQGGLAKNRKIELLIDTFKDLDPKKFSLIFMGYGPLMGYIISAAQEYKNIFFHEAVNSSVLLDYTSCADFGFVILNTDILSYYYSLPNKFFEYLNAGVPVISNNLFEVGKIIKDLEVGFVLENDTKEELIHLIKNTEDANLPRLKVNLAKARDIYNWENQEVELLKAYN
jgi:glycosyltransferase involved in cell wall biosynthesis